MTLLAADRSANRMRRKRWTNRVHLEGGGVVDRINFATAKQITLQSQETSASDLHADYD